MPLDISTLLQEAFAAYMEGNYEKSLALSQQAKLADSKNIDALHIFALSLRRVGRYPESIDAIISVLSQDINHHGAAHNFNQIILDAASYMARTDSKKEKEDIAFACYKAISFGSLHNNIINTGWIFPYLVKEMMGSGHTTEGINITRKALNISNNFEPSLLCNEILLDFAITDQEIIKRCTSIGVKLIRENKNIPSAFSAVLFWCYWNNKHRSLQFFLEVMKKRVPSNTIINSKMLHCWHMTRTDKDFYRYQAYSIETALHYTENHRARWSEGKGVIVISVDDNYWNRFARHLVHDLLTQSNTVSVHACIMNPTEATLDLIADWRNEYARFGYSTVETDKQTWISETNRKFLLRTYFACNRFLVLNDMFDLYRQPVIILDGDQVPIGNMDEFIDRLLAGHDGDMAIHYGTRLGPGRELVCDLAAFRPTPATHLFCSLVHKYIRYFLTHDYALWMLDQVAFYAVLNFLQITGMAPRVSLIRREQFPFDRYIFHPPDSQDKDALIHAIRTARAVQ